MSKYKLFYIAFALLTSPDVLADFIPGHVLLKIPETAAELSSGIFHNYFCGAVKISERAYLTASHCIQMAVPTVGKVTVGQDLQLGTSPGQNDNVTVISVHFPKDTLEIARTIVCHVDGCRTPSRMDWMDIALINVAQKNEIPVAKIAVDHALQQGTKLAVSGSQRVLGVVFIPEVANAMIDEIRENTATASLLSSQSIVNPGDSGSPVWVKGSDGLFELVGITSFAKTRKIFGFTILSEAFLGLLEKE